MEFFCLPCHALTLALTQVQAKSTFYNTYACSKYINTYKYIYAYTRDETSTSPVYLNLYIKHTFAKIVFWNIGIFSSFIERHVFDVNFKTR